jgi:UPF0755 protein
LFLSKTLRALCLGVALIALMVACVGSILLNEIRRPADLSDDNTVEFTVETGESTSTIATGLRSNGLIRVPQLFSLLVRLQGFDGNLQAGRYLLRPSMTMSQIIAALQTGIKVEERQVTIVEGLRLEEVAEQMGAAGLSNINADDFLTLARDGAAFKSNHFHLGSLPEGASLEGYLFPDTYRFATTATISDVIEIMLTRFDEQYATFEKEVRVPDTDVHKIVTMASIIQREATDKAEMSKVAAVFWNRLKPENAGQFGGGRLGSDPTVQYVLGQSGNWWPKLDTLNNDEINSAGANTARYPYNTRANGGLPPGPISNPGLAALLAAAQPDDSAPYLYFVASCETPGTHKFAQTFEEFNQYEQEYLNCPKP